jgi:hypothetical protein
LICPVLWQLAREALEIQEPSCAVGHRLCISSVSLSGSLPCRAISSKILVFRVCIFLDVSDFVGMHLAMCLCVSVD